MTDSVAVLESSRNKSTIESTIQSWLTNNTVTSVDHTDVERRGSNKVLVVIYYTA